MSSLNWNKRPFRIELKRQQNGKLLMRKMNFNQINNLDTDNSEKNFEDEKNLNIAIKKWSTYYSITNDALNSLQRILKNIESDKYNFQVINDGNGGLNINITKELLENIQKNDCQFKCNNNDATFDSDMEYNSEDPLEFEHDIYETNDDDYEPPKKFQRRDFNQGRNSVIEEIVQLPCKNLKQVSRFEIKLKRNRDIRKHFCSLILKEKTSSSNLLIFLEKCLGVVFNEYIFSKFNMTGANGKIKLVDNFIIKVISDCSLELYPTTNLIEVHNILTDCFDNYEKKNKIAILNNILCDKLLPMLKRNRNKISEENLIEDLDLPCGTIKEFLKLDKICQQKEYCQKLCMVVLNQDIAMASDFVENCFEKIFSHEIIKYPNLLEVIEKSFVIEILKQCTEQCFEDITMEYILGKLKKILTYISSDSIELTKNQNNIKYEIDIIDSDDNNEKHKDENDFDIENDEINDKKFLIDSEFRLPCTTNEELKKFDNLCRSNINFAENIKELFIKKDGNNIVKFSAECLNNIFNRALACTYNWTGSNGEKHTVHDLFFVTIIIDIGMKRFTDISKRLVELAIMRWFRYAQQRYQYSKYSTDRSATAVVPIEMKINDLVEKNDTHMSETDLNLPCETQEELKILNRDCESPERSKFRALADLFYSEKSDDPRRYARNCLERVLSQTLAVEYNWTGRGIRQKIAISNFPIIRILQSCYKEIYPDETLEQLERDCVKFFKYTNQRLSLNLKSTENIKDNHNTISDTTFILREIMKN